MKLKPQNLCLFKVDNEKDLLCNCHQILFGHAGSEIRDNNFSL